jgi:hypothetical protein
MRREKYYRFTVMPFELSSAVAVVTKLLQPVKAYLHKLGIKISLYRDDGRIVAASKAEVEEQLTLVLEVLQHCGWNFQWATDGVGSQQLVHLGFVTDTQQMTYFYPAEKEASFEALLDLFLEWGRLKTSVPVRTWASLLGKLQSMRRSHGEIVNIMSRARAALDGMGGGQVWMGSKGSSR